MAAKNTSSAERQMFPNLMKLEIVPMQMDVVTISQMKDLVQSCQNLSQFKLRMLSYETGSKLKIINDFLEHLFDKCSQIDTLQISSQLGVKSGKLSHMPADFKKHLTTFYHLLKRKSGLHKFSVDIDKRPLRKIVMEDPDEILINSQLFFL